MRGPPAALLALLVLVAAGCGSGEASEETLLVFGASSLEEAVTEYAESFGEAEVRTSFAGSDQLAAQIRQGAAPDVFASADTGYPTQLHREGLVERPRVFAANRLVVIAPAGSGIDSIADLAEPGAKIVIGDPSVPVGDYTRTVLARLPSEERRALLANVRSEEPEVSSVVAKVEQGAADAGFVYVTDARAAGSGVGTVAIPARLQPDIAYSAAVVAGSEHPELASMFLHGLIHGEGAADLRRSGFLPPP
jgi:molybdate transport system substrate-binding protein